ncbi:MAG: mechanosensitive ion channel family protein [Candidatus Limnocylindrales bacterium]
MGALADLIAAFDKLPAPARDLIVLAAQLSIVWVVAFLAVRFSRRGVAAIISALLDREVAEGTAQELSAIEVTKRKATLQALVTNLLQVVIVAIALLMSLQAFHLDVTPALAGLGIVGIAVGLGAQYLVRDYLAGSFILIENQYAKGDVIRIADVTGTVEDFSLRRTTLRDLDGTVHSVPNGLIGVSSNLTRVWARINLDVTVALGTDLDAAAELVAGIGREMAADPAWRRRVLEPPRVDRVSSLAGEGVTLKILGSVRAADRWAATGELRKRLATAFGGAGIEIRGS